VNQQITQIAQQVAQQTGVPIQSVQQIIIQIAIQIANFGGNNNQAIVQLAQQISSNPSGDISQIISQLAQQIIAGNSDCANQAVNQIAQQSAQGTNIIQVISQIVMQTTCPPLTPTPSTATLIVVKNVINDNGGILEPADFRVSVTGPAPNPPVASPFPAKDTPGTSIPVVANTAYQVREITREGYSVDYSDDCDSNSGIPAGQTRTCIITNDDESSTLRVIKRVINDDGGTLQPSDFQISVTGPSELSPSPESFPGRSGSGVNVELTSNTPYRVTETTSSRYNADFDECRSSNGVPSGETRTCIITNNDKERTDTTNTIIEYRETTPVETDVETIRFDKGIVESREIIPIADVSPYVMIGGHVLLNLPTGDFKLIAAETSSSDIEHAVLLNPQEIGSVRKGQTLFHVDLDDKMSGKNPFTNRADKVTEWTELWLYNSNGIKDIQVGDDNGWTATLVMAEFPGAKLRCPCEWVDTEIIKQGKSFFSANGMRVVADVRPFHVIDGHVALNLPREIGMQQSPVKIVALELDDNNKIEHAVGLNPIKIGDLNSAESLYHVNLAEDMSGKNPFTNRADKVTEWTDLFLWNSDKEHGLAMVDDNQVTATIAADR
jgi:prealbumin domain-containing protein